MGLPCLVTTKAMATVPLILLLRALLGEATHIELSAMGGSMGLARCTMLGCAMPSPRGKVNSTKILTGTGCPLNLAGSKRSRFMALRAARLKGLMNGMRTSVAAGMPSMPRMAVTITRAMSIDLFALLRVNRRLRVGEHGRRDCSANGVNAEAVGFACRRAKWLRRLGVAAHHPAPHSGREVGEWGKEGCLPQNHHRGMVQI